MLIPYPIAHFPSYSPLLSGLRLEPAEPIENRRFLVVPTAEKLKNLKTDCGCVTSKKPCIAGLSERPGGVNAVGSLSCYNFERGISSEKLLKNWYQRSRESDDIISLCGQRISCFYLCSNVYCAQTGTSALRDVTYEPDVGARSRFLLISQQVVTFSCMRNVRSNT